MDNPLNASTDNNLKSSLIEAFRGTSYAQNLEKEYTNKVIEEELKNPLNFFILFAFLIIIFYPYFSKRG